MTPEGHFWLNFLQWGGISSSLKYNIGIQYTYLTYNSENCFCILYDRPRANQMRIGSCIVTMVTVFKRLKAHVHVQRFVSDLTHLLIGSVVWELRCVQCKLHLNQLYLQL